MTQVIDGNNVRQAATAVSQHCKENSKGKAKQSAIHEAMTKFMGYNLSNAATGNSKPNQAESKIVDLNKVYVVISMWSGTLNNSLAFYDVKEAEAAWYEEADVDPSDFDSFSEAYDDYHSGDADEVYLLSLDVKVPEGSCSVCGGSGDLFDVDGEGPFDCYNCNQNGEKSQDKQEPQEFDVANFDPHFKWGVSFYKNMSLTVSPAEIALYIGINESLDGVESYFGIADTKALRDRMISAAENDELAMEALDGLSSSHEMRPAADVLKMWESYAQQHEQDVVAIIEEMENLSPKVRVKSNEEVEAERLAAKYPNEDAENIALAAYINCDLNNEVTLESAIELYNTVIGCMNDGEDIPSYIKDSLMGRLPDYDADDLQDRWIKGQNELMPFVESLLSKR